MLCFELIIQDVVCHVNNLEQFDLFVIEKVLFNLDLEILDLLVLAFSEFENEFF